MDFSNSPGRQDPHLSTDDTSAQRGGEPGSAWLAEKRLMRVISIDTAGVIYYNTDGTILFANEAFAGMSGYTYEQLASGTIRLDHITAPGSLNATGTEQQPGDTGHRAPCEQQYVRPDGSSWWGMFAGTCQDDDDECVGLIFDITEMKLAQQALGQSESRFRALSDALPQVIWTNDGEGKANYFNAKWYDYSGLSYEESFGIGWEAIVHPDDRAASTERWKSALITGTAFETEYRLRRRDGVYRWHLARNVPLKDDIGEITAWFGSATDIDAMKVSEYLNHQFIGVASHELKTPVTSIKAMTELVYEQLEAEKNHSLAPVVAKINGQVDRLSRLISDLLDTTRLEEGHMPLVLGEFLLSQKIDQCVEEIRLLAPDHRFRVVHGYKGTIMADSDRIGQVLTNLLINAMKYSERGSRVIVETKPVSSGVAVSVTDEGMGIPDNFLPKVFERFSRVDNEKMQTYPGMGLGLYIAAGIVARHGGTISVESTEGMGSKFIFILPYKNNKHEKINYSGR